MCGEYGGEYLPYYFTLFSSPLIPHGAIGPAGHTDVELFFFPSPQTIPRIDWPGFCLEDSPLGVRFADFASAFPAGINAAATWDVDLIKFAILHTRVSHLTVLYTERVE